jgi:hypothetical protein
MTKPDINPDSGQDPSADAETLRMQIAAGMEAIERGDFTDVSDEDLDALMELLMDSLAS